MKSCADGIDPLGPSNLAILLVNPPPGSAFCIKANTAFTVSMSTSPVAILVMTGVKTVASGTVEEKYVQIE
jgi:hypothetical protein